MRRADRLFRVVQLLRGGSVTTAAALAQELEVSVRTIYRDVQDLVASGVPIEGEAGIGYVLPPDFDLPPLMFDEDELAALVLGARMVGAWGGPQLAAHARSILGKVREVLPDRLKPRLEQVGLYVPSFAVPEQLTRHLDDMRRAISGCRKVRLDYVRADGTPSKRLVRPLALYFWGRSWTLLAWCELRDDFRSFRPDRLAGFELTDERFEPEPGRDLETFLARMGACDEAD